MNRDDGRTHHDYCWEYHIGCAVAKVKYLASELERVETERDNAVEFHRGRAEFHAQEARRWQAALESVRRELDAGVQP